MKTNIVRFNITLLWIALFILAGSTASSQTSIEGEWEGTFMGDFRTVVSLTAEQESAWTGKIRMYSQGTMIQDDLLSEITLEGNEIRFHIEAKQTAFIGTLNEDGTGITGNFIFPDESRHPLAVRRSDPVREGKAASPVSLVELKSLKYEANDLESDLRFLVHELKQNHPALYAYTGEAVFEKAVEELVSDLTPGLTLDDFFIRVASLLEKVHCSHTGARLPLEYRQLLHDSGNWFPLDLHFTEEKAFYVSCLSDTEYELTPGCEILSINGVPMQDIVDRIYGMIPSEGACVSTKSYEINRNFHSYFNLLDGSYRFEVAYRTPVSNGSISLTACCYADLYETAQPAGAADPVEFIREEDLQAALLRIPSFGIRDMEGYMQQLNSIFRDLRECNTRNLVVDLRGNAGGHPIFAAQLLSFLTDQPFTYFRRNPEISDFEPLYHPMQPDPLRFTGDVYVLVDGGCLSTTGHLLALLKAHTKAVFIGEEPGSSYSCNDFSIQVTLPHTGIEVNIPRTTFEVAAENILKGNCFRVDYTVVPDISQVVSGTDAPRSRAFALINGKASP